MNKKTVNIHIFNVFVILVLFGLALALTSCFGVTKKGCQHEFEILDEVQAVDCEHPGHSHQKCTKCGLEKTVKLVIPHEVDDPEDYISIQYCKKCNKSVRLESLETDREYFNYHYSSSMLNEALAAIDAMHAVYEESLTKEKSDQEYADTINELYGDFDLKFTAVINQNRAASVQFDMENTKANEDKYDTLNKATNEIQEKYRELLYDLFYSDLKELVFTPEDIEDLEDEIETFKNPRVRELNDLIDEMENDLYYNTDEEDFNEGYAELLGYRNEHAQIYGYETFYEYAHENYYGRSYSVDDLKIFRRNAREVLADVYAIETSRGKSGLSDNVTYNSIYSLFYTPIFNNKQTLELYMKFAKKMTTDKFDYLGEVNKAFKDGRIFISGENGNERAYTTTVDVDGENKNIMFFGNFEYYAAPFTLVHESGHFMFDAYAYDLYNDYDLFEVQSQTNEMFFLSTLSQQLKTVYKSIEHYVWYSRLDTVVTTTLVDEFEYMLYHNYSDLDDKFKDGISADEYDDLYEAVKKLYGVQELDNYYWHYYCTQSSVYEIAYAISLIPTLAKLIDIKEDFDSAYKDYVKLQTFYKDRKFKDEFNFVNVLKYANFANPFEDATYDKIKAYIDVFSK